MTNQSRRELLKGMAYGAAAATVAVSPLAWATKSHKKIAAGAMLPSCDITIFQQQSAGKEIVSLMNLTNEVVRLDSITPVNLEHINGSLIVKLNNVPNGEVVLQVGERLSFEVEAVSDAGSQEGVVVPNVLAGHLRIKSNHVAFNGIVPVTVFDSQTA